MLEDVTRGDFAGFWRGKVSSTAGEGRLGITSGMGCSLSNPLASKSDLNLYALEK